LGDNPTQNLASIPEIKSAFKSEHFCVSYALQTIHLFQSIELNQMVCSAWHTQKCPGLGLEESQAQARPALRIFNVDPMSLFLRQMVEN
jgi:hypothetical protein